MHEMPALYPLLQQLRETLGSQAWSSKDLTHELGMSRATATRHIPSRSHNPPRRR